VRQRARAVSLLEKINAYKKRIDFFLSISKKLDEQVSGRQCMHAMCSGKNFVATFLVEGLTADRMR